MRKEEQPRVPRSLFDRPTAALIKMRRDLKLQKLKQGLVKQSFKPVPVVNKPLMDTNQDNPEWLIHEDWALLQVRYALVGLEIKGCREPRVAHTRGLGATAGTLRPSRARN